MSAHRVVFGVFRSGTANGQRTTLPQKPGPMPCTWKEGPHSSPSKERGKRLLRVDTAWIHEGFRKSGWMNCQAQHSEQRAEILWLDSPLAMYQVRERVCERADGPPTPWCAQDRSPSALPLSPTESAARHRLEQGGACGAKQRNLPGRTRNTWCRAGSNDTYLRRHTPSQRYPPYTHGIGTTGTGTHGVGQTGTCGQG